MITRIASAASSRRTVPRARRPARGRAARNPGRARPWGAEASRSDRRPVAALACWSVPPRRSGPRGCGSMAERKLPKLETGVRFPSPAPEPTDDRRLLRARHVPRKSGAVGTEVVQRALLATRPPGLADLPPEPDQARRGAARGARPGRARAGSGRAFSAVVFGGIRPRRVVTRCTWVSTGIASRPSENASTTAAVFGPTPGSDVRYVARSVVRTSRQSTRGRSRPSRRGPRAGSPGSAAPSCPRGRPSGSRRRRPGSRAAPRPPTSGNVARSASNARSALRSLVCCDSTVRISSSSGSARRGGSSSPNRRSSRRWIVRTRRRSADAWARGRRSLTRGPRAAFRNCVSCGRNVSGIVAGRPVAVLRDDQLRVAASSRDRNRRGG